MESFFGAEYLESEADAVHFGGVKSSDGCIMTSSGPRCPQKLDF